MIIKKTNLSNMFKGAVAGTICGFLIVRLTGSLIESSEAFSMISAFILFPFIFLATLPWSLMIDNGGGNAVSLAGLAIGFIINCAIAGALVWVRLSTPRNGQKNLSSSASEQG